MTLNLQVRRLANSAALVALAALGCAGAASAAEGLAVAAPVTEVSSAFIPGKLPAHWRERLCTADRCLEEPAKDHTQSSGGPM